MTRPIPPDILTRIEAHEQWLQTSQEKGQQLFEGNLDLHDLDLSERNLMMCILPDANMSGVILRNTYMSGSNVCGVSFVDAILDGAWIVKTDAWEANLTNVHMHKAHCIRLDLQGARLPYADLTGTSFYNADFDRANLEYTNFSHTDLRYAYFYGAKMEHAILTGASVWDIALAGAAGIESVVAEWIDISKDPENAPQRAAILSEWLRLPLQSRLCPYVLRTSPPTDELEMVLWNLLPNKYIGPFQIHTSTPFTCQS